MFDDAVLYEVQDGAALLIDGRRDRVLMDPLSLFHVKRPTRGCQ